MPPREKNTINAINALMKDYPFAASLLIYALIEQELKFLGVSHLFYAASGVSGVER